MAALAAPCLFILVLSHELKPETQIAAQPTAIAFALSAARRRVVYESACGRRSSGMQIEGYSQGFTLIELSIVLVIIGLIVGAILVGQDLINAAATRAQIAQIEKFNTAVHTFQGKYGYLPGDMPDPYATNFGFVSRGANAGQGDGNGIIAGYQGSAYGLAETYGETVTFWRDLNTAGLIYGNFNTANETGGSSPVTATSTPALSAIFPQGKLGQGNYIYVYSGSFNDTNYYGLSALTNVTAGIVPYSSPALTPVQAYSIDKKIDDGLPQSGNVTAQYLNYAVGVCNIVWAAGGGVQGANGGGGGGCGTFLPTTNATPESSTTCYDNGNTAGGQQQYSLGSTASGGSNFNCALSFKFQ